MLVNIITNNLPAQGITKKAEIVVTEANYVNRGAKICNDLVLNGYSDWFMPGRDKLNKIYLNRYLIGGFSNVGNYWSSSECRGINATGFGFDNGDNGYGCGTKNDQNNIRAIRVF